MQMKQAKTEQRFNTGQTPSTRGAINTQCMLWWQRHKHSRPTARASTAVNSDRGEQPITQTAKYILAIICLNFGGLPHPTGTPGGASECKIWLSDPDLYIVLRNNYGSILHCFRDLTRDGQTDTHTDRHTDDESNAIRTHHYMAGP